MQTELMEASDAALAAAPTGDSGPAVDDLVRERLAPRVVAIDQEGEYPEDFLRELGALGGFSAHLAAPEGRADMIGAIDTMDRVSRECLSTGFLTWCQDACAWYVDNSENRGLRETYLPGIGSGSQLAGTGLSNPLKHFSGIESLRLKAWPVPGGYRVNGTLPWVSNLGPDHQFAAIFQVEGRDQRHVMALVDCASEGLDLQPTQPFIALEGTRTLVCRFDNVFIPEERIVADPVGPYLERIKAGFILLQLGMAQGMVRGCIDGMRELEDQLGHVNAYLDDRPDELEEELADAATTGAELAADPFTPGDDYLHEVLQLRLNGGELALRAANSYMLHAGARGYQATAAAQRRLREAIFVAIVTPATKHLRREIATLEERLG